MATIRKAYQILAMLAVLHLLALGGGVGYLAARGKLDAARMAKLVEVFKDVEEPAEQSVDGPIVEPTPEPLPSVESIKQRQIEDEIVRRNAVRHQAELDQRQAAIQLEIVELERQRAEFERYRNQIVQQHEARDEVDQSRGFKKELELFSQMKPRQSFEFLLAKRPEDAAHLLLEMPARTAKKVAESAKTPEERQAMGSILSLMGEVAPQELSDSVSPQP